jgi:hypothetical protein
MPFKPNALLREWLIFNTRSRLEYTGRRVCCLPAMISGLKYIRKSRFKAGNSLGDMLDA